MSRILCFNGIRSDMLGVIIEHCPDMPHAAPSYNKIKIPGHLGDILEDDGYDNITLSYEIAIIPPKEPHRYKDSEGEWHTLSDNVWRRNQEMTRRETIRNVVNWLTKPKGYCKLYDYIPDREYGFLNDETAEYREAYFVGPLTVENLLNKYGRAKINFSARPQVFVPDASSACLPQPAGSTFTIVNPYGEPAKPLIFLEGSSSSGSGSVTINGKTIYISGGPRELYIDCETENAYSIQSGSVVNENAHITASNGFFTLERSSNSVLLTSSHYSQITVSPRLYYI